MTPDHPDEMPLGAFARNVLRRDPSYATHLKKAGRLVLTHDGLVMVRESLELIEATASARGAGAAARHAENREAKATPPRSADAERVSEFRRLKAEAESRLKQAEADKAEMERDRLAGKLISLEEVEFVMRDIGAATRAAFELLPDRVAPVIFGCHGDLDAIHEALAAECRKINQELADRKLRAHKELDAAPAQSRRA